MQRLSVTLIFLSAICISGAFSQNLRVEHQLHWTTFSEKGPNPSASYRIAEGGVSHSLPALPVFSARVPVDGPVEGNLVLENTTFERLDYQGDDAGLLGPAIRPSVLLEQEGNQFYLRYFFIPVIREGNQYQKLTQFTARLVTRQATSNPAMQRNSGFKTESVLSTGNNFKIVVPADGLYLLDYNFLTGTLGLDPGTFSPASVRLFGNGGGVLEQEVDGERIDDFEEVALAFYGNGDQRLDQGEYFVFYGQGPDGWTFEPNDRRFKMQKNTYDTRNHYILQVATGNGLRISAQPTAGSAEYTTGRYLDYQQYEEDLLNILGKYQIPGSGKRWFGDEFSGVRERVYNNIFRFSDYVEGSDLHIEAVFAGRAGATSQFRLGINGQTFTRSISGVNLGDVESTYARVGVISESILASRETQEITITYPQVSGPSTGWLDYIRVHAWRNLQYRGTPVRFADPNSIDYNTTEYTISSSDQGLVIWDITNTQNPKDQQYQRVGQQNRFSVANAQALREFIAFLPSGVNTRPEFVGALQNQNLHGIQDADMAIIYHPDFESAANRLADHRRSHSNLNVVLATVDEVMNEFAGGSTDPTGIREFARMLFERSANFRYLLLFGDGSYDVRNLLQNLEDDSFVPVYESDESLHPITAFPSDDYYALLSPGEGGSLRGALDISVGRLPVGTLSEASAVVDKIIHYETSAKTLGDWRLRMAFVADDEDTNLHFRQSERIAKNIDTLQAKFNQQKIYLDAYTQESTPGGDRYPGANTAIANNVFKGLLVLNYLGHGGYNGWTQERVLRLADVQSWKNFDKLPLVVTATCSFTTYDEPSLVSAGEQTFLNPQGGAVAMFTTVRAVFSGSNERLTRSVFNFLFERPEGEYFAIGDILRSAKNNTAADTTDINARKFALIGDPALVLALPEHEVVATHINDAPIEPTDPDTIRALQKVKVAGEVRDRSGSKLSQFNGKLFITILDKERIQYTLANDAGSLVEDFTTQTQVIFKGTASVTNGEFVFEFVVPKDINFSYGQGKMSFYATDEISSDAAGVSENFVIGGAVAGGISDSEGPLIQIFMNDEEFVFGGITDRNPILFVKISDESGINVVGNSIGHDLEGELDSDTKNSFILNDFYQATLDDYSSGEVRYPLSDLEPGKHHVRVTAWDIANNFSESYTEFIVVDSEAGALEHVLNYPNPFTTSTMFQFEHNLPGVPMDIHIQIFTVAGNLVKTISLYDVISDGYRVADIHWDGRDDFGDQLAKGVYLYRVKLIANQLDGSNSRTESDFEKLVLLK